MNTENVTLMMIPKDEWAGMLATQQNILTQLKTLMTKNTDSVPVKHITAKEFMSLVRIKRTKFDQLVQGNKIQIIKKRRKIYVPVSEVERYFNDPEV